jgi:hypothetical protein
MCFVQGDEIFLEVSLECVVVANERPDPNALSGFRARFRSLK